MDLMERKAIEEAALAKELRERAEREIKKVEHNPDWNGRCAVVETLYGNQCTLPAGHEGKHNIISVSERGV